MSNLRRESSVGHCVVSTYPIIKWCCVYVVPTPVPGVRQYDMYASIVVGPEDTGATAAGTAAQYHRPQPLLYRPENRLVGVGDFFPRHFCTPELLGSVL